MIQVSVTGGYFCFNRDIGYHFRDMYLTPKFVRSIMDDIHQESIRHQTRVMNPDLLK
jgi:hypothetical protein